MSRRKDLFIQLSRIVACLGVCGVHVGHGYEVKGIEGRTVSAGAYQRPCDYSVPKTLNGFAG